MCIITIMSWPSYAEVLLALKGPKFRGSLNGLPRGIIESRSDLEMRPLWSTGHSRPPEVSFFMLQQLTSYILSKIIHSICLFNGIPARQLLNIFIACDMVTLNHR